MGLLCAAANTAQWLSKNPPLGGFLLPGEKNVKSPKLPIPIRKKVKKSLRNKNLHIEEYLHKE
jgi:hypothetical protein